jgi:hypothetical protein
MASAQNNNNLKTGLLLLENSTGFQLPIDSTGFSEIKNPIFYSKQGYTDAFIIDGKYVHLVDFNNDGLKDIIYQDKRHYNATILFACNGDDFIEIWSGPGVLVAIEKDNNTSVSVVSNAVGCFPITLLIELTIDNQNNVTENTIALHHETNLKKSNTKFEQQTLSGILRTQPLVDDEEKIDPCTGDPIIGNHIRTLEDQVVTAIYKEKVWWQVLYKKEDQTGLIGWVKIN